uniref:ATP-binding cassette domain-containing protein n=1 Tax=Flavobacterium sp. TaxID=239 RepID=UPI004048561D
MNYLSVENISKAYGERVLFDNVSFGINKDQKIAFIAKNGSGKTTIMNMINGFDEPDTGKIFHESVNDMPLGRNVNEYLRLID